jgi:DNA-directed RNA polymerase specialized sigma subunit
MDFQNKIKSNILSNKEIEEYIYRYRNGDINAAEKLLIAFEPFLKKFYNLLVYKSYIPGDKDIEDFLKLSFGRKNKENYQHLLSTILKHYERQDLSQEIKISFLETILSYTAITYNFKFTLNRRIWELVSDPLVNNSVLFQNEEKLETIIGAQENEDELEDTRMVNIIWGEGIFSYLDEEEKNLIYTIYKNKVNNTRLSKILGLSLRTFIRRKIRVMQKLSKLLEESPSEENKIEELNSLCL